MIASRAVAVAIALLVALAFGAAFGVQDAGPEPSFAEGGGAYLADLPVPRTEVAGTAWAGGIVAVGGLLPDGSVSDLAHWWDPADGLWTRLPDLPIALHHTTTVVLDDALLVLGGLTGRTPDWTPTDDVWVLDAPTAATWEPGPALPSPRGAAAATRVGTRVLLAGGVAPDDSASPTTWVLGDGVWRAGPTLRAGAEHLATAALDDDRAVVLGGRDGGLATATDTATVIDLTAGAVIPAEPMGFERSGFGATVLDGQVCVAGGEVPGRTVEEVECWTGAVWEVVGRDPNARHGLVVAGLDGALHIVSGGLRPGLTVSSVHWQLVP